MNFRDRIHLPASKGLFGVLWSQTSEEIRGKIVLENSAYRPLTNLIIAIKRRSDFSYHSEVAMKFFQTKDDVPNAMTFKKVSENGLIEIGIHRVIYGWRVRAGFVDSPTCFLDWCAGGNWEDVERLYAICLSILSKREENIQCFEGIPGHSNIKPFYKDPEFLAFVLEEARPIEPVSLKNELDKKSD